MKGNNGSGNIESRDEWETPQWLFDILHKQFNFSVDCCASYQNHKCSVWSDIDFLDYFSDSEDLVYWMNPPFSKALEMFRHFFKVVEKGVAIYRCDNFETKIWQEIIFPNASWVFIPNKRIAYEGMDGKGSRFPSALIGFNVTVIESLDGITLTPFGAFNKDLEVSASPTPKESQKSIPSLNPDIKRNKITHSQMLNSSYPLILLSSPQLWTQINKMEVATKMSVIQNKKYRQKLEKNKNDYLAGKISWTDFVKKTKSNRSSLKK